MIRIHDIGGKELRGSCVFNYRDYWVSASTVFGPNTSVIVMEPRKGGKQLSPEFFSVEEAITWIHEQ